MWKKSPSLNIKNIKDRFSTLQKNSNNRFEMKFTELSNF